jgi:hypothetical protein
MTQVANLQDVSLQDVSLQDVSLQDVSLEDSSLQNLTLFETDLQKYKQELEKFNKIVLELQQQLIFWNEKIESCKTTNQDAIQFQELYASKSIEELNEQDKERLKICQDIMNNFIKMQKLSNTIKNTIDNYNKNIKYISSCIHCCEIAKNELLPFIKNNLPQNCSIVEDYTPSKIEGYGMRIAFGSSIGCALGQYISIVVLPYQFMLDNDVTYEIMLYDENDKSIYNPLISDNLVIKFYTLHDLMVYIKWLSSCEFYEFSYPTKQISDNKNNNNDNEKIENDNKENENKENENENENLNENDNVIYDHDKAYDYYKKRDAETFEYVKNNLPENCTIYNCPTYFVVKHKSGLEILINTLDSKNNNENENERIYRIYMLQYDQIIHQIISSLTLNESTKQILKFNDISQLLNFITTWANTISE